jgi:hypothetical protein
MLLKTFAREQWINKYPVHDSIIVPETSSREAMSCLKECFRDRLGGEATVKA